MAKYMQHIIPKAQVQPCDGGPVKIPNCNDVLSGRGGRINNHLGNIHFRKLVAAEKLKYLSIHKKTDKALLAIYIVDQVRKLDPPGRFLNKDLDNLCWYEIGDECARKKAGQALREDGPDLRKETRQEENMRFTTLNNYGTQNELPMVPGIYSSPQYSYMPYKGQPLFYPQIYPPQYPREFLMHVPTPSISHKANPNLKCSGSPIGNPSQDTPTAAPHNVSSTIRQSQMTSIPISMDIEPIPFNSQNPSNKYSSFSTRSKDRQKSIELNDLIFEIFCGAQF